MATPTKTLERALEQLISMNQLTAELIQLTKLEEFSLPLEAWDDVRRQATANTLRLMELINILK